MLLATGCSTKNYVRSQTQPVIEHTNELDDATARNNRNIHDVDQRAQAGIQQAQNSANNANQQAQTASQAATQAQASAADAIHQADSLASVVANIDNYKQVTEVSVNFAFDKAELSKSDRAKLDLFATQLAETEELHPRGHRRNRLHRFSRLQLRPQPAPRPQRRSVPRFEAQRSGAQVLSDRNRQGSGCGAELHRRRTRPEPPRSRFSCLSNTAGQDPLLPRPASFPLPQAISNSLQAEGQRGHHETLQEGRDSTSALSFCPLIPDLPAFTSPSAPRAPRAHHAP